MNGGDGALSEWYHEQLLVVRWKMQFALVVAFKNKLSSASRTHTSSWDKPAAGIARTAQGFQDSKTASNRGKMSSVR
jgi:hypothetical protein